MPKRRRVAVAIDIRFGVRHHIDIYAGIHRFAQSADWDYELDPFISVDRRPDRGGRYSGIIARATKQLVGLAARAGIPMVNVWSGSPVVAKVPTVMADYAAAGRMAAEHLLSRGHRRFAFQGVLRHRGSLAAEESFAAAVGAAGFECTTLRVSGACDETPLAWENYLTRVGKWIAGWRKPLGVFVPQDIYCRFLANACRRAGLRIPEDVALIGLGNEPLLCAHPEPSLSSVDAGFERVGYEAAALLERLMSGGKRPTEPTFVEPKELVLRRSTDLWLVDNETVADALRFIAEHSHEKISVGDVALHACAAVRSLERHFRAVLGRTVKDEITRLRMERAKRLLVEVDEPIKFIARSCGFSGATYFHEAFIKSEGVTPVAYRRLHVGR